MFHQRFLWYLALVVLGGNAAAYADPKLEKVIKSKSELIAAEHGFTVVEDVTPSDFQIKDLEIVTFLQPEDNGYINGMTLRPRAVTLKANLGLVDAERMLGNQLEIPPEFRDKILVFTGTLLRDYYGDLRVACLFWRGGRWYFIFNWLDHDFDDFSRLVRGKPAPVGR